MTILNYSFAGKTILVTGAGRGLGHEIVSALCQKGGNVIALSKTQSKLDELKASLPSVTPVQVNIRDWNSTRKTIQNLGPINMVVNNAAVNTSSLFMDLNPEIIDSMFETNVKGVINVSQIVAQSLIKRKEGGSIVNISSIGARITSRKMGVYCATKACLDSISKNMAVELGRYNIRVNTVNPGLFASSMSEKMVSNPKGRTFKLAMEFSPQHRMVEFEEIVNTVIFLLSDLSPAINGQGVNVCTGISAYCG